MSIKDKTKSILNDVKDNTKDFSKKDVESGKGMSILSYIFPPIPYLAEKKNKFVRYHSVQGMNLLIIAIGYSIIYEMLTSLIKVKGHCDFGYWGDLAASLGTYCRITPWWIIWPLGIVGLGIGVLCIMGIVNVCNGKAIELPLINKIKIFK